MMITKHEGHGSFATQFLRQGSMGGIMKVNHLQSEHAYSSGENLSPRSVLEQRALSGLAIAIDLEEKMKLLHTQESAILCRFLSKQSVVHMGAQEPKVIMGRSLSKVSVGGSLSRERLNHEAHSGVGLKVVISMQQMSDQEGKAHENLTMGRSLCRERTRHEEREAVSGSTNVVASLLGGSSSGDPPTHLPSTSCERGQSTSCWFHELGPVLQQSFPTCNPSVEDSIFYYASDPPSTISYQASCPDDGGHHHAFCPDEDFLKRCFLCKRRLGVGEDIFMYRGNQAFCSVECRYEQIAKDECMGESAL